MEEGVGKDGGNLECDVADEIRLEWVESDRGMGGDRCERAARAGAHPSLDPSGAFRLE